MLRQSLLAVEFRFMFKFLFKEQHTNMHNLCKCFTFSLFIRTDFSDDINYLNTNLMQVKLILRDVVKVSKEQI